MCFRTEWECSRQQLTATCLMLNGVLMYLYVGALFQYLYVLWHLGTDHQFGTLYITISWVEAICLFVLLVDLICIGFKWRNVLLGLMVVVFMIGLFLMVAGSISIAKYTDVYMVVRSFYSDSLWSYETSFECCGINGPSDYGNPTVLDDIPLTCFEGRVSKPELLYNRGCIYATDDNWFWFVFENCYWFAFILCGVNLVTHWKLWQRIQY
ncbi:uncharacterized protein LOC116805891 [Drosophila grimshawi]|uniref:uncharacterized protein LOC116805891 n=1 Tax=Drosophila grimshawi TaxID=7222 RepID=UPI000C86F7B8|nr:uncharacterized protein LOC116805891 [Drosophila grimshawi]